MRAHVRDKLLTLVQLDYSGECPISHVPVAVCRSVGIPDKRPDSRLRK